MELLKKRNEDELWLCELREPYDLQSPFKGQDYVCFVYNSDIDMSGEDLVEVNRQLIRTGCCHVFWAGDLGEERYSQIEADAAEKGSAPSDEQQIMLTYAENENLDDMIYSWLNHAHFGNYTFKLFLILFIGDDGDILEIIREIAVSEWEERGRELERNDN